MDVSTQSLVFGCQARKFALQTDEKSLVNFLKMKIELLPVKLLNTLVKHAGKVLTHRFLLTEVWGAQYARESHYLRVFMASLRRKIETDPAEPRYLLTEQGVGYRLADR